MMTITFKYIIRFSIIKSKLYFCRTFSLLLCICLLLVYPSSDACDGYDKDKQADRA